MKQGTSYELLTREIYQILLDSEWLGKNICVEHDKKIMGNSGQKHQIDVYWEYELAGLKNRVAIECKDYSKPLSLGKVRDFYGVLSDLTDTKGIIVTTKGFQKGAQKFAKSKGINLTELNISHETPVFGELETHFHISVRRRLYMIDEEWAKENDWDINQYKERLSMWSLRGNEWSNAAHLPLDTIDPFIVDYKGNIIASIDELESKISQEVTDGNHFVFPFENGFVRTHYDLIKIKEVLITDKEDDSTQKFSLMADGFVKAILKDAISGDIQNILCPQNRL